MALTLALVDFLLSARVSAELPALAPRDLRPEATLPLLMELRKRFTPEEAAALLEQAQLRQKAAVKFPDADRLFFTAEALQQASSRAVAQYRAGKFAGYRRVADLGCGIGADTLALAESGLEVLAVERDPVRARLAEANVTARGLIERVQVLCADWTRADWTRVEAAFVDPGRRVGAQGSRRRVFSLHSMEPPLAAILALAAHVPAVAVKVAPGVDYAEIPPQAGVEFISERGELKEALLLFGALAGDAITATLLPGAHQLRGAIEPELRVRAPGAYFYEPDPAVIRAGLVRQLAAQVDAAQVDADIAYLTADTLTATPFARAWETLRHGPFNLKELNRWLREFAPGEVVVKKRGSPVDPDAFRRRLKVTPGGPRLTVFLTHVQDRPWMLLGREMRGSL